MGVLEEIDVTLVAARRPHLLELTLRSFRMNLLRHLKVGTLFVNIDPIWGNDDDAAAVRALCRIYFDHVVFHQPDRPSFCSAVQWLWSQSQNEWFLHLEDDWCLAWRINVAKLRAEAESKSCAQISFFNHGKTWRRGVWARKFTTSPSLIKSDFGRIAAQLMNTDLDPEKQLYDGRNPALVEAISGRRHRFHGSRLAPHCIVDTGREWREIHDIEKNRVDGVSTWTSLTAAAAANEDARAALDRYERRLALSRFLPRV